MSRPAPRYRALAAQLRTQILNGRYGLGDQLPTEHELCAAHEVSRHTAREALRLLQDDGLIARKRGAGTVVIAARATPAFAQPIGDFEDILQYAREAVFEILCISEADPDACAALSLDGAFMRHEGVRRVRERPAIAHTVIYIAADLTPDPKTARTLSGSYSQWIERAHGVAAERVTQRLEAAAAPPAAARLLGLEPGAPALRTLRRYCDGSGRVILLSDSLHPADRFAYEMELKRTR